MRELGDRGGIAGALNNLGDVVCNQGDYPAAKVLLEECLAIMRELGDRGSIAGSLNNLGEVACNLDDREAARAFFEESLAIRRELGDRSGVAYSLGSLGSLACDRGDLGSAQALCEEGLVIQHELGDKRGIASLLEGLAAVVAALGRFPRAARIWGAAERLREEIGSLLPPNERARYDRRVTAARTALQDSAGFDRAWREGRASTIEQAIELALKESVEPQ
jgi:tetratricopeptide (TPR) repeat protein